MVAINKDGQVGCAAIQGNQKQRPEVSFWSKKGFKVKKGSYLIEI